ncbi:hypothetical protein F5B22DRAFT_634461 [Xylaria bambusicola]|uniref:uncharacterized protein n=1 Tax=Xylaria bambusicola TaxID=326684 RepID=UPI00200746FF|nr:uncharacterized protein F5B22DRAFT_634461 [Xylaria bambusicola]KAI0521550.1 hypothetical protein F5B22DRAFT_634461 [Xylaria bambusicola]
MCLFRQCFVLERQRALPFFLANIGRVEGLALRAAFLPKLTPAGNKYLRDRHDFVREQLKHYGVSYNEEELTGNGTLLLKKVLSNGRCDCVPPDITKPDHAKTTEVIGFPIDRHSSYRSGQLREATASISGLHHATSHGPKTQTIFAKAVKAAKEEREAERSELYNQYLKTLKRKKGTRNYSPIEGQWPDQADDLSLDICTTDEAGIYEASFDFGILEGVMTLSMDKAPLEKYCAHLDMESDDEENIGSSSSQYQKYYLKLRCTETGEGHIFYHPSEGSITLQGDNMATFTARTSYRKSWFYF